MKQEYANLVKNGMITEDEAKRLELRYRQEILMKHKIAVPEPKQRQDTKQWLLTVPAKYSKTKKRHQITRNSRDAVIEVYLEEVYLSISNEKRTVTDLVTEYLYSRQNELKVTSMERYTRQIRNHIKNQPLGEMRVSEVTLDACREYIQSLYQCELGKQTMLQMKSLISSAFDYAVAHDYITTNYMRTVRINSNLCSTAHQHNTGAWTDDELHTLWTSSVSMWESGRKFRYSAAVMFLIYTGCRVGELLGATWDDVDFNEQTFSISKTLIRCHDIETGHEILTTSSPKTASSRRTIYLNDMALFWLKEIQRRNQALKIQSNLIVPTSTGRMIKPDAIDLSLKKFCLASGVRYIGSHAARRTYASVLIDAQVPISEVSHDLGHKNISMTQNAYYKRRSSQAQALSQKNAAFSAATKLAAL